MIQQAQLPIPVHVGQMQNEVLALTSSWLPHFNTEQYDGEWTVLALRSPAGDPNQIVPEERGNQTFSDTPVMEKCPAIRQVLKELHCPVMAVRLMNVKAGAVIKEHRDLDLAFENGEARLHFPVFTNAAVAFIVNDRQVRMQEGDCWYVNVNLPHKVANHGDSDRIHLVVDCLVNDWLKDLFSRSIVVEAPPVAAKEVTTKIIHELRLQNTETANRLADAMEKNLR